MPTCCWAAFPPSLLGGEIALDVQAARQSHSAAHRAPAGLGVDEAAAGIVEIVNNNMARAIRTVSIGRGHDPRQFVLVAFGGAGPLHACRLAELLDIPAIVIPPTPGVLSTYGLLSTDLKNDYVQTCYQDGPQFDLARITAVYADLEAPGTGLGSVGAGATKRRNGSCARPTCAMRIRASNSPVPCPTGPVTQELLQQLVEAFHHEHRRLYSYDLPNAPVELVNLRVTAIGHVAQAQTPGHEHLDSRPQGCPHRNSPRLLRSDGWVR